MFELLDPYGIALTNQGGAYLSLGFSRVRQWRDESNTNGFPVFSETIGFKDHFQIGVLDGDTSLLEELLNREANFEVCYGDDHITFFLSWFG